MKWYDFIAILGLFLLGFGIYQVFYMQYWAAYYYDVFVETYTVAPYENQFIFNLLFTGIVLSIIGISLNVGLEK